MARNNSSNPYTQDPAHTQKDVQMAVSKARVVASKGHPDKNGFHTVRIRVYGDDATYVAPVTTPMFGCVWVPKAGTDVAVMFDEADKPWIIGSWYAIDRVEDGDVDLPDYDPGDIRIGNESDSHVTVKDDGRVIVNGGSTEPITDVTVNTTKDGDGHVTDVSLDITRTTDILVP